MNENEAKKVELTDDKLNEVSGGSLPFRTGYPCEKCGRYFGTIELLKEHTVACKGGLFDI